MAYKIKRASQVRNDAVRAEINTLLNEFCTEEQRAKLNEIHSHARWKTLADLPDSELDVTYELVRRTVLLNITRKGES